MTTTVVLADDEILLRRALASLLPLEGDITVLAEAADGAEAVTATLAHRPDVLVIDLEMPNTDGLRAVRNYLSSAIQKTQTDTRHRAARYAREHGWL